MDLYNTLVNRWIEFSGGSRPRTNNIRFLEQDKNVLIQLNCVFDWETQETINVQFLLTQKEFDGLVEGILKKGHANLRKREANQDVFFEWRYLDGRIAFKLEGQGYSPFEGRVGYQQKSYQDIILDIGTIPISEQ